jgi:tetratricopeptide (TPR) repeat protein
MSEVKNHPKTVGRYEVRGELGGGGMGDVYRVWDPETRRELALKVLKFTYPRALHYFKREFRAVASLSHPNLVALYDLHLEDDKYFYTMELVEGCDFYVFVNGHNRVINEVARLYTPARLDRLRRGLVQLLRGLAYLHQKNCVHRDIKPSNILVDTQHRVRLVDFGIVKELIPGGEGQSLSQVFGTSTYFSPEQSLGSDVGPKADLYSVGVLLFELLSGRPPFVGASADVALKHRTTPPPALPQQSELGDVCLALLRKAPDDRPSAREALEMLRVDSGLRHRSEPDCIGRVQERRALHEALDAVGEGEGRVFVIEGDSGMGKTKLVDNFAHRARLMGATVFTGTCVQRDHVPMRGLDTLVERLAEAYRRETARILRRFDLGERAALIDAFGFLGELLPESEHGDDDGRSTPASGLHRWLNALAVKRRLVLVIEHLHLADDAVCDVLENLLSGGPPPQVMLIVTVRSDQIEQGGRLWDFLDFVYTRSQSRRIEVKPFTLTETRQYLTDHMRPPPVWLAEYIQDETGGNPLFVASMVDEIRNNLGAPPPTLNQTIERQFERLGKDARAVVTALAVNRESLTVATMQDATGLNGEALYEALRHLSAEDVADLMTSGEGRAFIVGAHEPLLMVVRKRVENPKDWHQRLALAHEKNRGPGESIRLHWMEAGLPDKTELYARQEAERARVDGDHPRAVEMIQLAIDTTKAPDSLSDLWANLVDSLARCGRHARAAAAIGELDRVDPGRAYSLRGRRCQFHLLAGQLADFEKHAVDLPSVAHVPLADALIEFLPSKAAKFVKNSQEAWARLVQIQLMAQSNTDGAYREAERLLAWCKDHVVDQGPEWAGQFALAEVAYLGAVGRSSEAVDRLWETLDQIAGSTADDTLLNARLRIALGRALIDDGHIGAARKEIGHLLRTARKRQLPSIRALASILQSRAVLAGGDELVANGFIEEAGRVLPSDPPSIPHARLVLVRAFQALVSGNPDEAERILDHAEQNPALTEFLNIRDLRRAKVLLRTRLYITRAIDQWIDNGQIDLAAPQELLRKLASVRPYASPWSALVRALESVQSDRTQEAVDTIGRELDSKDHINGINRARLLAMRSLIRNRLGKGGRKDWVTAMDALRAVGADVPAEFSRLSSIWQKTESAVLQTD